MIIEPLTPVERVKLPLPNDHKLNIRWRQMRACYQVFSGRSYLVGASGDTPEEAISNLHYNYILPENHTITLH